MSLDEVLPLLACEPTADVDLAEIALLLAREEYSHLDVEGTLCELTAMAHDVRSRLRGPLAARVSVLSRYLFHELGFRGNSQNYYDPRNSYFNLVLERRIGIPITLSLVAIAVGTRAGLNIEGVGLPGHFIAKAVDHRQDEVLFDPFHGGRLLTPVQCKALVEEVTGTRFHPTPECFAPASAHAIVVRLFTNLKGIYLKTGDFLRAARIIRRMIQLLPDDPTQRRDLGASLLHSGQPGRALEHLDAYLQAAPQAADADSVQKLLKKARCDIARWN